MVRLLICAGGTGGGVYPALAVRQALGKDAEPVLWVGGEGGMEADLVQRAGIPFRAIPAGQIAGMGWKTLPNMVRVMQGTLEARRILKAFKPDVLLFTGGFVAVPMALAGWAEQIPSVAYVPDIEPGLALKVVARLVSALALTTESSGAYFAAHKKQFVTGYPTRPDLAGWNRAQARAHLGLQPERFTLLVTGGSKGARTLNRPFLAVLPELLKTMQVVHITGQAELPEAIEAASHLGNLAEQYHPLPYLHEMGAALAAADMVLSRAGASTLGEYPLFGLPAILVPYPYAWRYQKVNADYLVQRGAAVMLETEALTERLLPTILELAGNPQHLQSMSAAMRSLAHPRASEELAELVQAVAAGNDHPGPLPHTREDAQTDKTAQDQRSSDRRETKHG